MTATKEEYHEKLQRELKRTGATRDEAVRSTNIALGYGSSTALQYDVPDKVVPEAKPK